MSKPKIEQSSHKDRFTDAELNRKVQESHKYWASPVGKRKAAQLEREQRNRKISPLPVKFPDLAKSGSKPTANDLIIQRRRVRLLNL